MFYVKSKIADNAELRIELDDENVYNHCPGCGAEVQVDLSDLFRDGVSDFYSTSVYCKDCTAKLNTPEMA